MVHLTVAGAGPVGNQEFRLVGYVDSEAQALGPSSLLFALVWSSSGSESARFKLAHMKMPVLQAEA